MTVNPSSNASKRILWSRFLTHSGDQAWDFAVPLALIGIFPAQIDVVSFYYLVVRFCHMLLVTRLGRLMDRWHRLTAIKLGIGIQTLGVIVATAAILSLSRVHPAGSMWAPAAFVSYVVVIVAGLASSLGSTMMDIAVSQDWIPTVIPRQDLAKVNSHLKQIDLGTELGAPVVAGLLMAVTHESMPLLGFLLIALWNVISFFPEYQLLRGVFRTEAQLADKVVVVAPQRKRSPWQNIAGGWRDFMAQPAALSMTAYALLWVTVLSPHGVLLTAWMKAEWGLSEAWIGLCRGLGAVFGLGATVIFPQVLRRMGLVSGSRALIVFEAACLLVAGAFFYLGKGYAVLFLAMILLSRVGLYGFTLGETEIRQVTIPQPVRGQVNGFASALTSLATLGVYGAGSLLKSTADFGILVYGSIAFVCLGALTFSIWSIRPGGVDAGSLDLSPPGGCR